MSIKPLDLQTLFIKMAQVGKEQASIQKSVENQQAREANQLIKEEMNRDHSVNKTEDDKAVEKSDDESGSSTNPQMTGGKKEEKEDQGEDKPKYFTDPERGHNIDISG